jgi:L-fuconolactonase
MMIDAHQHFWQLDQPFDYGWLQEPQHRKICRDFLPQDLRPLLKKSGVSRSIFVQTQHDPAENLWALQLADSNDFLAGVVGWVDLASAAVEQQLLEFREHPLAVGIRHITQDEPDDDFIIGKDVLRGLKVLQKHEVPFDLLFYDRHLKHATTVARELPELPMVIDHLSKPRIRDGAIEQWTREIRAAAEYPNLYCKLSGMVTEADWDNWTAADLRPYVETALEAFGAERCMYGSDWPVCELAADYGQVRQALVDCLGSLTPTEERRIFGETAVEFYKLNCGD